MKYLLGILAFITVAGCGETTSSIPEDCQIIEEEGERELICEEEEHELRH